MCYPHRRLSPHTRRPRSGCDGLSQLKRTPSILAREFNLAACRKTWLDMLAGVGDEPTPCQTSQPGSLHCSSDSPSPLSNWSKSLLALIFFFFLTWAKVSQNLLDRFSWSFQQMNAICVYFFDPDIFFDSFRDIAMATDFVQNLRNDLYSTRCHFAKDSNIAIRI